MKRARIERVIAESLPRVIDGSLRQLRFDLGVVGLHQSLSMLRELERTIRLEWERRKKKRRR